MSTYLHPSDDLFANVKTVPHARDDGSQEGVESPRDIMMKQRASRNKKRVAAPSRQAIPPEVLEFEKKNGISIPEPRTPDPVPEVPVQSAAVVPKKPRAPRVPRTPKPVVMPRETMVVSIEIAGVGTYKTPAYDVIDANYGVLLFLPKGTNDTIFIPNAGTSVVLSYRKMGDKVSIPCFYPGIMAEVREPEACILAFVKADESASAPA